MVRCCDIVASDPLLRHPFFVHTVRREQGLCTLLVHVRGRGTAWLVKQQGAVSLDILGPMGHGWTLRPAVRNLLLISGETHIPALTLLAQHAIEQGLAVSGIQQSENAVSVFPPPLLPPKAEDQIFTRYGSVVHPGELTDIVGKH